MSAHYKQRQWQNWAPLAHIFSVLVAVAIAILLPPNTSAVCLDEQHRLQFHFSPVAHWSNDPNGMIYYDGEYHLYFQHHPYSSVWGTMHWGHATSTDMVHWTEQPIAIYPDPDLGTIYSGSSILDVRNASGFATNPDVVPIIAVYTSAGERQQQSISYSNDRGRTFEAYVGNPVISNGADGSPVIPDFRDPKVIEYSEGQWSMVLAAGHEVIFYETRDLKTWVETGRFGGSPPEGARGTWECPDILRLLYNGNVYWVLLVSVGGGGPNGGSGTQYFIGDFDGRNFKSHTLERVQWLDYGPDNYAGVTFSNELLDRHIYIAWMANLGYAGDTPTAPDVNSGWRGQFTIPRGLDLVFVDGRLRLRSTPAPELASLRNPEHSFELPLPVTIESGVSFPLFGIVPFRNPLLELEVTFNLASVDPESFFALCFYNRLRQELCITYERMTNRVNLNRGQSGRVDFSGNFNHRTTADRQTTSDMMTFKLFLDMSSVEVFVDGGLSTITALFFPDEPFMEANVTLLSPVTESRLVLESATVKGLNSIYDCFDA